MRMLPPAGAHMTLHRAQQLGWSIKQWSAWETRQDELDHKRALARDVLIGIAIAAFALSVGIALFALGDVPPQYL